MTRRLLATSLVLLTAFVLAARADLTSPNPVKVNKKPDKKRSESVGDPKVLIEDAAVQQEQLRRQFDEVIQSLLRLAQRLENSPKQEDKEKAQVLRNAIKMASKEGISTKFNSLVAALKSKDAFRDAEQLETILQQNQDLRADIRKLIEMLLQDNRDAQLKAERERLTRLLEELKDVIKKQERHQQQVDIGRRDTRDLKKEQERITKQTSEVGQPKKNNTGGEGKKAEGKDGGKGGKDGRGEAKNDTKDPKADPKSQEGKGGEGKDGKGEGKEGKGGEGKKGEGKDGKGGEGKEGKAGEGKGGEGKEGKAGEGKSGEGKPGEGKGGEGKEGKAGEGKGGEGKEGKAGEGKGGEGKEGKAGEGKEGKPGEGKPGEGKPGAGKPGAGKPGAGKQGKPGEGKPGSGKPGAGKPGEGKPGSGKPGAGKPGEGKSGSGKPTEAKSGSDTKGKGEGKGSGKGGKPGAGKPGSGKPGEAKGGGKGGKGGQGQAGQGKSGGSSGGSKGGQQGDQKPNDNPARKQIQEAGKYQKKAEDDLGKDNRNKASDDEEKAIAELKKAQKKLEDLLKQIREEEIERLLAQLEGRCRHMLQLQIGVRDGTVDLDKVIQANVDKRPTRADQQASEGLGEREDEIVREAAAARRLIEAEGSAVAFAEVFKQVQTDMETVANHLRKVDTGKVTVTIENDIIDTLQEMIAALKQARQDNKSGKSKPGQGGGKPQAQPLLKLIQELKMIRSMQARVNARTIVYGKQYKGEQVPDPSTAKDPKEREHLETVQREVKDLGARQEKIHRVTNDIATGKNEAK